MLAKDKGLPVVGSNLAAAWKQGAEGLVPQAQAQVSNPAFLLLTCKLGLVQKPDATPEPTLHPRLQSRNGMAARSSSTARRSRTHVMSRSRTRWTTRSSRPRTLAASRLAWAHAVMRFLSLLL